MEGRWMPRGGRGGQETSGPNMKQRFHRSLLVALSTVPFAFLAADETAAPAAALPEKNIGEKIPGFRLQGLDGKEWALEDQQGPKAIVLVMLSTGCPMSNAYLET